MKHFLIFFIFIFVTFSFQQSSWGGTFQLAAGKKKLDLELEKAEWSNFCLNDKSGCARFKIKSSTSTSFGFIKTLTVKSSAQDFYRLCRETFEETQKIASSTKEFVFVKNINLPHCSWSSNKDFTLLSLKDGITIIISISDKSLQDSLLAMLNRAKLHETL